MNKFYNKFLKFQNKVKIEDTFNILLAYNVCIKK